MPFMLEAGQRFDELFPGLPNLHFAINIEDKAGYHAMCVVAGNFAQLLWEAVSDRFGQQFELPAEVLHPYLKQIVSNFIQTPETALTGPLSRNDEQTIEHNLNALEGDPMQDLYRAFVDCYKKENGQNKLWEQAS